MKTRVTVGDTPGFFDVEVLETGEVHKGLTVEEAEEVIRASAQPTSVETTRGTEEPVTGRVPEKLEWSNRGLALLAAPVIVSVAIAVAEIVRLV